MESQNQTTAQKQHFCALPKTTPLFPPGVGIFVTQLQASGTLRKLEIPKAISDRTKDVFNQDDVPTEKSKSQEEF